MSDHAHDLEVALEAARAVMGYARTEYDSFEAVPDAPVTITTPVDLEVQRRLIAHIQGVFPDDGFFAEEDTESARVPGTSGRVWVIDPIDGTRGFAQKTGEFSVMIGLTVANRPALGVVAEPIADRVTYATRNGGCRTQVGDGPVRECRVSGIVRLAGATMTQSRTKRGSAPKRVVEALNPGRVVETYSAGIKLAQVARGEVDLYANDHADFMDWDICAGHVLVVEAGGKVTILDGTSITYGDPAPKRQGLIATNAELHPESLQKLAVLFKKPDELDE